MLINILLPTTRENGVPITLEELDFLEVAVQDAASVAAPSYTAYSLSKTEIEVLPQAYDQLVYVRVVDKEGQRSEPATLLIPGEPASPPSPPVLSAQ
jgi:hypothetical protein